MRNLLFVFCALHFPCFAAFGNDGSSLPFLREGQGYALRFASESLFRKTEGILIEPEYYSKPNAVVT
jgi:hypothetical protein